jgi:lipopolysaccharide/colanic/teichoic acid biosynthesis glycosyltransferase
MWYCISKRALDLFVSLLAIILLSPVFLLVAIFVLVKDGRPVLYLQDRVGLDGRRFRIVKFRSMIAEEKREPVAYADETWKNGVPDDFVFKRTGDSNVTKTGNFLRKYSLDELPQFFNVLGGSMSIVGPRPEIPAIADYYNESQRRRLSVKPGITGWAQVNGRSILNNGRKMECDMQYVARRSFFFDLRIICITIMQAVRGQDAV